MKYSEAEKQIKALSSKYNVKLEDGDFYVVYNKNVRGIFVGGSHEYVLDIGWIDTFSSMPLCNKLYMILSELAMTPLEKRVEEKKYYAHVFKGQNGYLNVFAFDDEITFGSKAETNGFKTKFTSSEIEKLKQRDDIPLDWSKVTLKEVE